MSVAAVSWVLESTRNMEAGRRMVLVAMADHANRDGLAWASLPTLAESAGCSRDTARRAVNDAAEYGWIVEIDPESDDVPAEFQAIRADRRPILYQFTGLHGATPFGDSRGRDGVATGSRRGSSGGAKPCHPNREPGTGESEPNRTLELVRADTIKMEKPREQLVFEAWIEATGRTDRTVFSTKRLRLIRRALDDYPLEDVLDAVRGWRHSPHHCGNNDRGTVYNDLGLLLRDAEHIEAFRDFERKGTRPRMPKGSDVTARNVARMEGLADEPS